jgi:hypothetical protein
MQAGSELREVPALDRAMVRQIERRRYDLAAAGPGPPGPGMALIELRNLTGNPPTLQKPTWNEGVNQQP